jgi:hypothetical protein
LPASRSRLSQERLAAPGSCRGPLPTSPPAKPFKAQGNVHADAAARLVMNEVDLRELLEEIAADDPFADL